MERPIFSKDDLSAIREWYITYFQTHSYRQSIKNNVIKRFDDYIETGDLDDLYHELRIMGVRFKEDEEWN